MKKLVIVILCLFLSGTLFYCQTKGDNGDKNGKHNSKTNGNKKNGNHQKDPGNNNGGVNAHQKDPIPAAMKEDGLISVSTYQVFITAFGNNEQEARAKGLAEGRRKAVNLMRKDPVLRGKRLNSNSVRELKQLVQANARIVRIQQEQGGAWSVVLQVERRGLKNYLKSLP